VSVEVINYVLVEKEKAKVMLKNVCLFMQLCILWTQILSNFYTNSYCIEFFPRCIQKEINSQLGKFYR